MISFFFPFRPKMEICVDISPLPVVSFARTKGAHDGAIPAPAFFTAVFRSFALCYKS